MTDPSLASPPTGLQPPDLVDRLAAEMTAAWRRGERPPAEPYLDGHPELLGHPEEAVRLVYEEVCLRQEFGPEVTAEELSRRFPRWADELAVLLDCHRLVQSRLASPLFPAVSESLGDFRLVAELGRGTHGRVYLATQPALADRPVVLKVTPRRVREHLSLARLQHTHIIPLHAMYDFPERGLRATCMPFLGGATLARILELLRGQPLSRRTGQSLVEALDAARAEAPVPLVGRGGYRQVFAGVSYVEAVCRIAVCLAEGLHHAHERGLVHLDLKPSNVLLAADAQPLLLDFHLALRPLPAGREAPEGLGGTPAYMSPEQERACAAARCGKPVPEAVDRRSDLYSLGRLLYVALAGDAAAAEPALRPLHHHNPQVSVGLSDIIHKCLAANPNDRYPDAATLTGDLRRHLTHLPLQGVSNRSWRERWRKWRRRRPNAPLWTGLLLALVAGGALLAGAVGERHRDAQDTLTEGQDQVRRGVYHEAVRTLARGKARAQGLLGSARLAEALDRQLLQARRAQAAEAVSPAPDAAEPASGEYAELGLALLCSGKLEEAAAELERATDLRPQDFGAHFFRGVCAYRREQYADAVHSFGVAIALAPESAPCYHNRALAYAAWGKRAQALRDCDKALLLQPRLAAASLNRGILHYREGRHTQARADLEQALLHGADPAAAHYNIALVHLARRDEAAARQHVERALAHTPTHAEARALQQRLHQPK
jgi:serine/threonine protein kinase/Flp pilus assembly protein TadD